MRQKINIHTEAWCIQGGLKVCSTVPETEPNTHKWVCRPLRTCFPMFLYLMSWLVVTVRKTEKSCLIMIWNGDFSIVRMWEFQNRSPMIWHSPVWIFFFLSFKVVTHSATFQAMSLGQVKNCFIVFWFNHHDNLPFDQCSQGTDDWLISLEICQNHFSAQKHCSNCYLVCHQFYSCLSKMAGIISFIWVFPFIFEYLSTFSTCNHLKGLIAGYTYSKCC